MTVSAPWTDACRFVPTAGGTANWTYSAAVLGYNSPSLAAAINGLSYTFRAESADLTQWEIASGVYNSGTGVFARTTVLYNSSGTGTLQSGAGTKISFNAAPQVAIVALTSDLQWAFFSANGTASRSIDSKIKDIVHVKDFGAKCNTIQTIPLTYYIPASSTALYVPLGTFAAADVGKTIVLPGAAAAGLPLIDVIAAYVDAEHVTLTTGAPGGAGWGLSITTTVSITSGAAVLSAAAGTPFSAVLAGQGIRVPGAGAAGGNLDTTVVSVGGGGSSLTLASNASTTLTSVSKTMTVSTQQALTYGADDTQAVKDAVTKLNGVGGSIGISGKVLCTSSIIVDYTSLDTKQVGYQNTTINFHGDGSGNSQLIHAGFSGILLDYRGKNLNSSLTTKHHFRNFSIMHAQQGIGTGMNLSLLAFVTFSDLAIFSAGTAINGTDILTSAFFGCTFDSGVFGLIFAFSALSRPNAISLFGTSIIGYNQVGLQISGGTAITWHGGTLERCGVFGSSTRYGAIISNAGSEGGVSFAAYGLHVEANLGDADFFFSQDGTTTDPSLAIFDGCNFNRGSTSGATTLKTTNNISVSLTNPAGHFDLRCISSFRHFTPYTPSTSEPAIAVAVSGACEYNVDVSGSYFGDNKYRWKEATPRPHALVKFNGSDGSFVGSTTPTTTVGVGHANVSSVTRVSAGVYTINLRNPLRGLRPIIAFSCTDLGFFADFGASTASAVTVKWFNPSAVATDPTWLSVIIFDSA